MSNEQAGADSVSVTGRSKRPRAEDSESSGGSVCPTCEKEVSSSQDGVQCEWCHVWEHCKCAKLSVGEYNMLSMNSPRVMFFCCDCHSRVNQALEFFDNNSSRQSLFEKRLQRIEIKIDKLSGAACSQNDDEMVCHDTAVVAAPVDAVPARPSGILPNPEVLTAGGISSAVESVIAEEKDKDKRKMNVILHNVIESTAEDGQTRKTEDINVVSDIFQKGLGVNVKVCNAVRLGKRENKPRLLKVTVDSVQSRATVLRNCTKLRSKDNPENLAKIFITPDMTQKQREANKALRAELAELNKDGRKYKIKNGKIVRRDK